MNKKQLIVACVFGILLLSGCATGYNKRGLFGGYENRAITNNIFEVSFSGNGFLDMNKAEALALLRCASLTLENGYGYFIVSDKISQMVFFNTKPTVKMLIQCSKEKPEDTEEKVYEAKKIKADIETKYKIKEK